MELKFAFILWVLFEFQWLINVGCNEEAEPGTENVSRAPDESEDEPESDSPVPDESTGPPDYSNLIAANSSLRHPRGGILLQYTQPGLNYIMGMVERAASKLMRDFPIPDTDGTGYSVKNVKVSKFEQPAFKGRFIDKIGLEIQAIIPKLEVTAAYSVGTWYFGTKGNVVVNIDNFTVYMLMSIVRGRQRFPSITLPHCAGKLQKIRLFFAEAGWTGAVLNTIRGAMESIILTTIGNIICFEARNFTKLIEQVFLDFDKPLHEIISPSNKSVASDTGSLPMSVICGEMAKKQPSAGSGLDGIASHALKEMKGLSFDLHMEQDGYFRSDDVIVGLKADFSINNEPSGLKPKEINLAPTQRSLCFSVSQMVPNGFCKHGQAEGYFILDKKVELSDIPLESRQAFNTLCKRCDMHLKAHTTDKPRVEFSSSGIRAFAKVEMNVEGRGILGRPLHIANAVADVDCSVKLFIKGNVVHGTVSLGNVNVQLHRSGIGKIFDAPLNVLLRNLVPKVIWPIFERKVNGIMKEKGFQLPAACGLTFNNSQILYADDRVTVCTDFNYDIDGFLDRFTKYQRQQLQEVAATTTSP